MKQFKVHSIRALGEAGPPQPYLSGVRTLCIAVFFAILAHPSAARADCPAAPIGNADDMAISFLAANGVQAASASQLASAIKDGTLIYDSAASALKVCDGTNWVSLQGEGAIGTAAGSADEVQFRNVGTGAFAADSTFVYDAANHRLGVGTAAPAVTLHVASSADTRLVLTGDNSTVTGIDFQTKGTDGNVVGSSNKGWHIIAHGDSDPHTSWQNGITIANYDDTVGKTVFALLPTGSASLGINVPKPSALLDLTATDRGFLPPRMTAAQRDLISSPAVGLVVYNTTDKALNYYDGTAWTAVGGSGGAGSSTLSGLSDVSVGSQSNGQALIWNSTSSKWEPGSVSGGGPSEPMSRSGTLTLGTVYGPATSDGLLIVQGRQDGASGQSFLSVNADTSNPPTTQRGLQYSYNNGTGYLGTVYMTVPIKAGEYYRVLCNNGTSCGGTSFIGIASYYFVSLPTGGGSSQWIDVPGGINFSGGNVGIGITTPSGAGVVNAGAYASLGAATALVNGGAAVILDYASGGRLFTQNATPLRFLTDNAERMRIDPVGNVGIGTASPVAPLDVQATGTSVRLAQFLAPNQGNGLLSQIVVGKDSATNYAQGALTYTYNSTTPSSSYISLGNATVNSAMLNVLGNGNVGIGSVSPSAKLDVNGSVVVGTANTANSSVIAFRRAGGDPIGGIGVNQSTGLTEIYNSQGSAGISFNIGDGSQTFQNNPEVLRITESGSVGIGTTNPSERLDLGGGNIKVGYQQVVNNCGSAVDCVATCPAGKYVTGGGCWLMSAWVSYQHEPTGNNAYHCMANGSSVRVTAICANVR
ncbi:hypothetical protein DW352_14230 [Pseudolabrys taiwanensis]|uniref:Uncharacterized protein n=1 Tax=Pseudolabrys taiwanensis TaxID=331696 RepID=A0A345ZXC6_9HYPH|nr:hypothetical protein [Pseudolabrys taiwanensis]AXK81573.1 hypothetical protein DW352_14230 [Pseudolabrys taiwanensis]